MYEFSQSENGVIGGVATRIRVVGVVLLVAGLLIGIGGVLGLLPSVVELPALPADAPAEAQRAIQKYQAQVAAHGQTAYFASIAALIEAVILFSLGLYARRAAGAFQRVVDTAGDDVQHMMAALDGLRRFFGLLASLIVLALLLGLAVMGAILWARFGGQLPL